MDLSLLLPLINLKGNFLKTSGDLTSPLMYSECPKYTELKTEKVFLSCFIHSFTRQLNGSRWPSTLFFLWSISNCPQAMQQVETQWHKKAEPPKLNEHPCPPNVIGSKYHFGWKLKEGSFMSPSALMAYKKFLKSF